MKKRQRIDYLAIDSMSANHKRLEMIIFGLGWIS